MKQPLRATRSVVCTCTQRTAAIAARVGIEMSNAVSSPAPSEITRETRSGRRWPSAFAKCPPRLWPIRAICRPASSAIRSARSLERVERAVRAADVPGDAGAVRPVAHPLEPAGHHRHRRVPGEEAGDQHHRAAVAARDALARVDGVDHQPPELRLPAQLGAVVPPPVARRIGRGGRGRGGVEGSASQGSYQLGRRRVPCGPQDAVVGVAQLVELLVVVQAVAGSSPVAHLLQADAR